MGGSLKIRKDQVFKMMMMIYKGNNIKNQNPYSSMHSWNENKIRWKASER